SAQSLRDCILEVRGGGVRLNILMRRPITDANGPTVAKMQTSIDWKTGRPARKLRLLSSQIQVRGDWLALSEKSGPDRRQMRIGSVAARDAERDPELSEMVLALSLQEDGTALRAELDPPVRKIDQQVDGLRRRDNLLQTEILSLTQDLAALEAARTERQTAA